MKMWFFILFVLIVGVIAGAYILIPSTINLQSSVSIKTTRPALYRLLQDENSVAKWWPGNIDSFSTGKKFSLHNRTYKIEHNNISLLPVTISAEGSTLNSALYMISPQSDIVQIEWIVTIASPANPLKRISQYFKAKELNNDMQNILRKISTYFSDEKNIYGFNVSHLVIVDSTFIFTEKISPDYPSTNFIYNLIEKLRIYVKTYPAKETNYPILNISNADSGRYLVKVALPLNKDLPSSNDIESKRMPVNVRILMTEIKGGTHSAANAFTQMQLYVNDNHWQVPGLPFFSLVTDRFSEPDTSKWITRIYFPIR